MLNKEILKGLADNPALFAALKELIYEKFAMDQISTSMNNEVIGQIVRANIEGKKKVEDAFREIEQYKTAPVLTPYINRAK